MKYITKGVAVVGAGMIAFLIGWYVTNEGGTNRVAVDAAKHSHLESDKEVLIVYFGSSTCGFSNVEDMPEIISDIESMVRERYGGTDVKVGTVGVALDGQVGAGLSHLEKMGGFDEVAVGHRWVNHLALEYIWQDIPGPGATPQVVVIRRTIKGPDEDGEGYRVSERRLIDRKAGIHELRRWVSGGDDDVELDRH